MERNSNSLNVLNLGADGDAQIIGILGQRGNGKSCLTVAIGYEEWRGSGKKRKVVSNYRLRGIPYESFPLLPSHEPKEPVDEYKMRILEIFMRFQGSIMLIDEAHGIFESRGSGSSKQNIALTFVLSQIRKLGIDLVWNAQMSGTVDLRMRGLSDYLLVCVKPKAQPDMTYAHVWMRNELGQWRKTDKYIEIYRPPYHDLYEHTQIISPVVTDREDSDAFRAKQSSDDKARGERERRARETYDLEPEDLTGAPFPESS